MFIPIALGSGTVPVINRSLYKADCCRCLWLVKKIKLDTEAISEFLVADTDSESCSEASDFEEYFEEEEEVQQQQQASADIET
jgi:hypothetical protein